MESDKAERTLLESSNSQNDWIEILKSYLRRDDFSTAPLFHSLEKDDWMEEMEKEHEMVKVLHRFSTGTAPIFLQKQFRYIPPVQAS